MDYPKEIKDIFDKFDKAGYRLFLVGGSVRDFLLKKPTHDWDFTTDAKPEEILKIFPDGFYNNKFGTVGVPIVISEGKTRSVISSDSEKSQKEISRSKAPRDDNTIVEITTMRKEGDYADHRHPVEVSWTDKIEEDLKRRDFTINAMAMDKIGKIVDPFAGQEDLNNGLLRAVGDADQRFEEDALRLLRAIRIANQLEFEIEEKTLKSIGKNKELIKEISNERIRDELFKMLGSKDPYQGIKTIRETGLLKIILPELDECFGIVQEGPKHDRIYDIGEHSLLSLKFAPSTDPLVRFATLLHDVGKVPTYKVDEEGNALFYNHDIVGGSIVKKIAERLKLSNAQTDKLYKLVRYHMFSINENQTDSAIRRFIKNAGRENIDDMFALRVGDRLGGGTAKAVSWRMEKYKDRIDEVSHKPFSVTDLKINGEDVMKSLEIPPSRKVGEILNELFKEVLENQSKNDRDYLLGRLKKTS